MTDLRTSGAINRVRGAIEQAFGRLTGSRSTEVKGKARNVEGHVQGAVGGVVDSVHTHDAVHKHDADHPPA